MDGGNNSIRTLSRSCLGIHIRAALICLDLFPVFHHLCKMRLPWQEARRFRSRHRRSPRRKKDRERADGGQQSAKDQGRNIAVRANVKESAFHLEFKIMAFHFCGLFIYRVILQISMPTACMKYHPICDIIHCNISTYNIFVLSFAILYRDQYSLDNLGDAAADAETRSWML